MPFENVRPCFSASRNIYEIGENNANRFDMLPSLPLTKSVTPTLIATSTLPVLKRQASCNLEVVTSFV